MTNEYVLIAPTYDDGNIGGVVLEQVIRSLNGPDNQVLCRGVISSGNINFGKTYRVTGDIITVKLGVLCMYKSGLLDTPEDVSGACEGLEQFWQKTASTQA